MDPSTQSVEGGQRSNTSEHSAGDACRIALLYPGDREARIKAAPEQSRFLALFRALRDLGVHAEPAVYHDDFHQDVRAQLAQVDGVLVWVNPIQDGRDRTVLNALLRDVAANGVYVSAHPEVIDKIGTKEVLYRTRHLGWGCDTHLFADIEQMRQGLPLRLAGGPRVVKRLRGHSGSGVWKVERDPTQGAEPQLRVRHAQRGAVEERIGLDEFCGRCEQYFALDGGVIDQAWQPRLPDGMVRCYLVHGRVEGFGLQAINALYPGVAGASPQSAPAPGPRLYHPPTLPAYQPLKHLLEQDWVPALQKLFDIDDGSLPALWDCDFLLGAKDATGADSYVLCEINVSSVAPFPESAVVPLAHAALAQSLAARAARR